MCRWTFFSFAVLAPTALALGGFFWRPALWGFALVGLLVALGLHDVLQRRHSLLRVYPVIGQGLRRDCAHPRCPPSRNGVLAAGPHCLHDSARAARVRATAAGAFGRQARGLQAVCRSQMRSHRDGQSDAGDGNRAGFHHRRRQRGRNCAAPVELSNSVGMPLREGLVTLDSTLRGFDLRSHVRLVAAGQIVTGFHLFRALALGANLCNSARAMMFSLGCIQARACHTNDCPVGVATQNPQRAVGLVVQEKAPRVARYQQATVKSLLELVASAGLSDPQQVQRYHVLRRTGPNTLRSLAELYPVLPTGALLSAKDAPPDWRADLTRASSHSFQPAG